MSLRDAAYLRRVCDQMKIPYKAGDGPGKLQIEIFEKTGEHTLVQPTFAYAYPAEVSPLSRRNDPDPFITDRWEFFIGGRELANGFSELNDAEDQAQRFKDQVARKDAGDEEAMYYDADYVRALEYGMPPTAGLGLGRRPAGDAVHELAVDPRCAAVPAHAARVVVQVGEGQRVARRSSPRSIRAPWIERRRRRCSCRRRAPPTLRIRCRSGSTSMRRPVRPSRSRSGCPMLHSPAGNCNRSIRRLIRPSAGCGR